jgi:hypothetical protein
MSPSISYVPILVGLAVGILFVAIGVIFLVVSIVNRKKASASQNWPAAQGQVTYSSVREEVNTDENGVSYSYIPVVQYTYTVMGQQFTGNRISFGAQNNARKAAEEVATRYSPGSAVTVHYNPDKPQEATLETKAGGSTLFLIVGIIFAVIGIAACCIGAGISILGQG